LLIFDRTGAEHVDRSRLAVVHNTAAKRFEIDLDGKVAFSKYLLVGER